MRSGEFNVGFFRKVDNLVDPRAALLGELVIDLFATPAGEHEEDETEILNFGAGLEDALLLECDDGSEGQIADHFADGFALCWIVAHCSYALERVAKMKNALHLLS